MIESAFAGEPALRIAGAALEAVREHARSAYPEECCGVLVGVTNGSVTEVTRVVPTANAHRRRADRYEIPPQEILTAMTEARAAAEEVVGYFHSHPDRPASPSRVDLEESWPGLSYLIVSVDGDGVAAARSWRRSGGEAFDQEQLVEGTSSMRSGTGWLR